MSTEKTTQLVDHYTAEDERDGLILPEGKVLISQSPDDLDERDGTTVEAMTANYLAIVEHDTRIAEASRALREAHLAVADAAGAWYDSDGGDEASEDENAAEDLRRAVEAWRKAAETLVQAMRAGV